MFETVGALITSFFQPRVKKIHTGSYIFTRNQSNESVIIYNPIQPSYSDVHSEQCDEMSILLLKCERLISHFKSKMNVVYPGYRAHALNNQLAMLVNDIIHDIENGVTCNVDEYHERYSYIRAPVTATSMSSVDLNNT
jgi:hypothetical protein